MGNSSLLNILVGSEVAITAPKPQTARFPIKALYESEQGQIIFIDTPGIFGKAPDLLSSKINQSTKDAITDDVDIVIYMIDHTRRRDMEEAKVLGIVRKINKPKILVINKIDQQDRTYLPQYEFLKEEIKDVFEISSLARKHIKPLLYKIF